MGNKKDHPDVKINIGADFSTTEEDVTAKIKIGHEPHVPDAHHWRILFVGDLTPGRESGLPRPVDRNSFSDFHKATNPTLALTAPERLSAKKQLAVDLAFSSLKDFTPDAVAAKISQLDDLFALRKQAKLAAAGKITIAELIKSISGLSIPTAINPFIDKLSPKTSTRIKKPIPSRNEETGAVDDLLSMIDTGDDAEPGASAPDVNQALNGLIRAVSSSNSIPRKQLEALIQAIDALLSDQLDQVLHNEDFIALETVWRELKVLVDHADPRNGLSLTALGCNKVDLRQTLLEQIFRPAWNDAAVQYDVIVCAHHFDRRPPDLELLDDLAQLGQSTMTLMLAGASASFFDQQSFADLEKIPSIAELLGGPGYEKWRALREKEQAEWLVLATNGFCLRDHYGPEGLSTRTFNYLEKHSAATLPQGFAPVAVAAILQEALERIGKDRELLKRADRPVLETMPVFPLRTIQNRQVHTTCTGLWSGSILNDLFDSGLTPISCRANDASIILNNPQTAGKSGVSIPQAVLVGHLSRYAMALVQGLSHHDEAEVLRTIRYAIIQFLQPEFTEVSEDSVQIQIGQNPEIPDERILVMEVKVPYRLLGQTVSAQIAFSI